MDFVPILKIQQLAPYTLLLPCPCTWMWAKMRWPYEMEYNVSPRFFRHWPVLRQKTDIKRHFWGYITQDIDSAEVFYGIDHFCRFFALKDFLSYRPLKLVWTDPPTTVRVRVNRILNYLFPMLLSLPLFLQDYPFKKNGYNITLKEDLHLCFLKGKTIEWHQLRTIGNSH